MGSILQILRVQEQQRVKRKIEGEKNKLEIPLQIMELKSIIRLAFVELWNFLLFVRFFFFPVDVCVTHTKLLLSNFAVLLLTFVGLTGSIDTQESNCPTYSCLNGDTGDVPSPSKPSELQDSASVKFSPKLDFDDGDIDDELDPAMKEEIDRLVYLIIWSLEMDLGKQYISVVTCY